MASDGDQFQKELVFATHNANKVKEVNKLTGEQLIITSLSDYNMTAELPETHTTLEENAEEKVWSVYQSIQQDCFAEDTGLEVDALHGEPGVYSARYAGPEKNDEANLQLLLDKLGEKDNRSARFRTVIALVLNGRLHRFEGRLEGDILPAKRGTGGFGYDPVFCPKGHDRSLAEMDLAAKNAISHRAKAIEKLLHFVEKVSARS